jgi:hypothetical protein
MHKLKVVDKLGTKDQNKVLEYAELLALQRKK